MAWKKQYDPRRFKKSQIILTIVLILVLVAVGFLAWALVKRNNTTVETTPIEQPTTEQTSPEAVDKENEFDALALQAVVDDWVLAQSGTPSVVIADKDDNVLAAYSADQVYFAASIYKLYVAYEGYKQVDNGDVDPEEIYINGNTRAECLDLMIRESDSPCAEKLMAEIGQLELTNTLRSYGITNTSMTQITTTSRDASILLGFIMNGEGLTEESQQSYLKSMREQIYRDALNKGFSEDVVVYNKIGFREQVEYHDVAIIELVDGRKLIVSVLTENVGTANIADLARKIEAVL